MTTIRNTFDVLDLLTKANDLLDASTGTPEFRRGVAMMIEHVLRATGNYAGYNFIAWSKEGGYEQWVALNNSDAPTDPYCGDGTRRFYYHSKRMIEAQRKRDAT